MSQDYKITEFNSQTAQIVVNFIPLNVDISIDLPIDSNGNVPTGDVLDTYIKGFLPYGVIQRQALLQKGIKNSNTIIAMIQG